MRCTVEKAKFVSGATAYDTYIELGFVPDFLLYYCGITAGSEAVLVADHTGAWAGPGVGVSTETIEEYAGGDVIANVESVNTNGKHVDVEGVAAAAGHITSAGVMIPAALQTNALSNLVVAFRFDQ